VSPQHTLAEAPVLAERRCGRKRLTAVGTFDLLAAVGVHPLVAAKVRKLRVGLEADFALERFHGRVNVLVLLESARRGEGFPAVGTRMGTAADGSRSSAASGRGQAASDTARRRRRWRTATAWSRDSDT
jgi:hypothetical protein